VALNVPENNKKESRKKREKGVFNKEDKNKKPYVHTPGLLAWLPACSSLQLYFDVSIFPKTISPIVSVLQACNVRSLR
jgi:hypothetical protein